MNFRLRELMILFLGVILNYITKRSYRMSFSKFLMDEFKLSTEKASLFFNIDCISYFIIVQKTQKLTNKFGSIKLVFSGFFLNCIILLFIGSTLYLPHSLFIISIGLLLSGISSAVIYGPIIAFFLQILNNINFDEEKNCDISGFLFNFFVIIGQFIGPIIGGFIIEHSNFQFSCNFISLLNVFYLVFFYLKYKKSILKVIDINKSKFENNDSIHLKTRLINDFSGLIYNHDYNENMRRYSEIL